MMTYFIPDALYLSGCLLSESCISVHSSVMNRNRAASSPIAESMTSPFLSRVLCIGAMSSEFTSQFLCKMSRSSYCASPVQFLATIACGFVIRVTAM